MSAHWRIELLVGLRAQQDDRLITRFSTQKTGALLAYLAFYRDRVHSREVLFELFWPECIPEAGRRSLRVALSSLRHQLEPPGVPQGAVIIADRNSVRLNPVAVTTDVAEFEAALQSAARAKSSVERVQHLTDAVELYRDPLLPDYYENWILLEQQRLAELFFETLRELLTLMAQAGDTNRALHYALKGVGVDPLREEAHRDLMRFYVATGQPDAALRQFHELERILTQALRNTPDAKPTAAIRELAQQIASKDEGLGMRDEGLGRTQASARWF
jgi:DNA-binding SARP family transcriptional activator